MKTYTVLFLLTLCLTVSMADAGWGYSVFEDGVLAVEQWWQPFYDVYPTPVESYGFTDFVLVKGELWCLGSPDRYGDVVPYDVDHIQVGPVGGEMFYRLVEGSPRTEMERCNTMVYWGGGVPRLLWWGAHRLPSR